MSDEVDVMNLCSRCLLISTAGGVHMMEPDATFVCSYCLFGITAEEQVRQFLEILNDYRQRFPQTGVPCIAAFIEELHARIFSKSTPEQRLEKLRGQIMGFTDHMGTRLEAPGWDQELNEGVTPLMAQMGAIRAFNLEKGWPEVVLTFITKGGQR